MRRAKLNVFLVCVCLWAVPAVLWAQADDDPNAPQTWDPADHLVAAAKSIGMVRTFDYRPSAEPPWQPGSKEMRFVGRAAVTDPTGLIGLASRATEISVLDEAGRPMLIAPLWDSPSFDGYFEPVVYTSTFWTPTGEMIYRIVPFEFSFDIVVPAPGEFPSQLSRIEWSMDALLSDTVEAIDLPFAPSEEGIELSPGLQVFVEQTSIEENRYQFRSTILVDSSRIAYPRTHTPLNKARQDDTGLLRGYLWSKTGLPEMVVLEIDVLDADGVSIQNYAQDARTVSFVIGTDSEEDLTVITQTLTGTGRGCGAAAFIRYVVARDPYRQEVRFVLEDIPVPNL